MIYVLNINIYMYGMCVFTKTKIVLLRFRSIDQPHWRTTANYKTLVQRFHANFEFLQSDLSDIRL